MGSNVPPSNSSSGSGVEVLDSLTSSSYLSEMDGPSNPELEPIAIVGMGESCKDVSVQFVNIDTLARMSSSRKH